jgi:hypothetical protein
VRRAVGSPFLWGAIGVAITLSLRLPFLDAPLGRDEAGDTMVALAWHHSGPFAYGPYFLDRPPLLVALFRLAAVSGGVTGVRILGAVAACAAVVVVTALAARVGGRRSVPFAAVAIAVMVSSLATMAVYTPAELIAIVPASASILMLVIGLQHPARRGRWLAGAGAAAAAALLVKQSFADPVAAGVVGIAAAAWVARPGWRRLAADAGAYVAGFGAVALALVVWALLAHASAHSVWYSMFGFRVDSAHALTTGNAQGRLTRLGDPALRSGLVFAVAAAAVGIATLRSAAGVRPALAAWLVAGGAGILLSGSFWPHYVIQVMPVAAIGTALLLSRRLVFGALALCLIAVPAAITTANPGIRDSGDHYETQAVSLGRYVADRAEPGQTAYVMYARVNALFYTGLRSPYPYHWSLMMRTIPGAVHQLRALLASPQRPVWIIGQDKPKGYGLDHSGATAKLVREHYRVIAHVCHKPILLERGQRSRAAPQLIRSCVISPAPASGPA